MVNKGDLVFKLHADKIAKQGHQRLEPSKPQAYQGHLPPVHLPQRQTLAHRHGKGIHGKANSHQEQFQQTHLFYLQIVFWGVSAHEKRLAENTLSYERTGIFHESRFFRQYQIE